MSRFAERIVDTILVVIFVVAMCCAVAFLGVALFASNEHNVPTSCERAVKLSVPIMDASEAANKIAFNFEYAVARHLGYYSTDAEALSHAISGDIGDYYDGIRKFGYDIPKLTEQHERYLKLREKCLHGEH